MCSVSPLKVVVSVLIHCLIGGGDGEQVTVIVCDKQIKKTWDSAASIDWNVLKAAFGDNATPLLGEACSRLI